MENSRWTNTSDICIANKTRDRTTLMLGDEQHPDKECTLCENLKALYLLAGK